MEGSSTEEHGSCLGLQKSGENGSTNLAVKLFLPFPKEESWQGRDKRVKLSLDTE